MLNVIEENGVKLVVLTELYDGLGLSKPTYARWVENNLVDYFEADKDYFISKKSVDSQSLSKGQGRKRVEYLLTIDCAKHIAMMAKTATSKEYRDWLIGLDNQVESGELVNLDEAVLGIQAVSCFSVKENRKEIEKMHYDKFVANGGSKYAWHEYRNRLLDASKDSLMAECAKMGILTKSSDTRELLWSKIDAFGIIRETALEFAYVGGSQNPKRFANIVYGFAKRLNLPFVDTNDPNLFYQPIPVLVVQSLLKGGSE